MVAGFAVIACQETDNSGVEKPIHCGSAASRIAAREEFLSARRHEQREGSSRNYCTFGRSNALGGLARVVWKEAAAPLCLLVQNRAQQEEILLAIDPTSGATRELLREKDSTWLNLDHKPMPVWLKNGREFLWTTERNGGWQVELHSAVGALVRAITPVDFNLDAFIGAAV